ncbi:MAG: tetratricopeptide repeat protein [Candidatus Solibacter usitatus]|nr:tetratricopeptide repeat protein [Candidatus Solibacter usitatus]
MRVCLFTLIFVAVPIAGLAQKQQIQEIQRDVATLQDQVRTLQRGFDEKIPQISLLLGQVLEESKSTGRAVAVLEARVSDKLAEHLKVVGAPVATLGTKVDQMSTDFQSVVNSMNDVVSRLGKLEQKMVDLKNAFTTITTPPPPATSSTAPAGGSGAPPVPAETLYENALRDKMGGKPEIALQGFQEYIKHYASTEKAPNAYYWLGQIYYDSGDLENALKNFDAALEYDKNNKTQDCLLMKGRTLLRMGGKRTAAVEALRKAYGEDPKSEAGAKACSELKSLTVACAAPAGKKRKD